MRPQAQGRYRCFERLRATAHIAAFELQLLERLTLLRINYTSLEVLAGLKAACCSRCL